MVMTLLTTVDIPGRCGCRVFNTNTLTHTRHQRLVRLCVDTGLAGAVRSGDSGPLGPSQAVRCSAGCIETAPCQEP